ncbi:MAG: leucyl/phenylalanyl-tRNA--protein transferase [Qipengyuania sp.]|nr:leucyl/phenylalanyl-tRNA--protein transferase [Qipengyuania sp.]
MHAPVRQPEPIPSELLLLAYRSGIFPMADHRDDAEVYWVEPQERAIIPLDGFRLSKSLAKVLRRDRFRVSCDEAFAAVIAACAAPREEHAESWISRRIEASYLTLHALGHAHSIECWLPGEDGGEVLAGGLYGVAFDRVFCGESMFSRADDASKVALAWLVAGLRRAGFELLDCQFMTRHLASLGAVPITQKAYLRRLEAARGAPARTLPQAVISFAASGEGAGEGEGEAVGAGLGLGAGADAAGVSAGAASSPGKRIAQSLTQTS